MQGEPRNLHYQDRCAIQALKQSAYAIGAMALGNVKSAAAHGAAATAWGALAKSVAASVKAGLVKQWMIDALWIEPLDYLDSGDDETGN